MKFKNGFVLRRVLGDAVVIATGEAAKNFQGMVKLNETAATILENIDAGMSKEDVIAKISTDYEVDSETVAADVEKLLEQMLTAGIME